MSDLPLLGRLLLAIALAGCAQGPTTGTPTTVPTTTSTTPTTSAQQPCHVFTIESAPASPVVLQGATFWANFTNCGATNLTLEHACLRAMDVAIVTQNGRMPIDGPIANQTTPCATAPPFGRNVEPATTQTFSVHWVGLYANGTCQAVACYQILPPGRYLLEADALDAATQQRYVAATHLTVLPASPNPPTSPTPPTVTPPVTTTPPTSATAPTTTPPTPPATTTPVATPPTPAAPPIADLDGHYVGAYADPLYGTTGPVEASVAREASCRCSSPRAAMA
jgi:hypothetical protein